MTGTDLYVFNSNTFKLKSHMTLKTIETVIVCYEEHTLIGIHSKGKADILLDLSA